MVNYRPMVVSLAFKVHSALITLDKVHPDLADRMAHLAQLVDLVVLQEPLEIQLKGPTMVDPMVQQELVRSLAMMALTVKPAPSRVLHLDQVDRSQLVQTQTVLLDLAAQADLSLDQRVLVVFRDLQALMDLS